MRAFPTFVAVILAFMALDDITTDKATTGFVVERVALAGCGLWFAFVTYRLWQDRRRLLAAGSAAVLTLAVIFQPRTPPGSFAGRSEYLASIGALLWFLAIAILMAAPLWRARSGANRRVT